MPEDVKKKLNFPCDEHDSLACLVKIVKQLRGKKGCPWDQKQTPVSLTRYLSEETQELIEAITSGDNTNICEEIGDLFFILTMLTNLYEEKNTFTIQDSLRSINEKMIRRHPHVFADKIISNDEELRAQWKAIKKKEKIPVKRIPPEKP